MPRNEFDKDQLKNFCQNNDIAFLGMFGSTARGEAQEMSDVDLLVRFSTRKSLLEQIRIEHELEAMIGKRVDLQTENSVSPYLVERIVKETKPIYG